MDACTAMKPDWRPISLTSPMPLRADEASTWGWGRGSGVGGVTCGWV